MESKNTIQIGVLVDFDGTITKRDTLFRFFIYTMRFEPGRAFPACILAPLLAILFIVPGLRKHVVSSLLWISTVGCSPKSIVKKLEAYSSYLVIKGEFNEKMIHQLRHHKLCGHHICVISASPAIWIRAVMKALDITDAHVIGSRFKFFAGGLVMAKRCAGVEKVRRLRAKPHFQWRYAYSDSAADLPMLSLARQPYLVGANQLAFLRVRRCLKRVTQVP